MATRDKHLAAYRRDILSGMAGTLWRHAWINWAEDAPEGLGSPARGESWDDYVPDVPPEATTAAAALVELYEHDEKDIVELYGAAITADTGRTYEFDTIAGRARAESPPSAFGAALAEMALGTGTSWFDDHKRFELARPYFECWTDSEELYWSGRTMEPGEALTVSTKARKNPSRAELRDVAFVQSSIKSSIDSEFKQKVASIVLKPGPTGKVPTEENFKRDLAANLTMGITLDDEGEECGCEHKNPPGRFTAKGERMYQDIKRGYEAKGDPRAAELAARAVYAEAKKGVPDLLNVGAGRPPGVPNPGRFRRL